MAARSSSMVAEDDYE
ncbi:hypothetical protein ZEAMMB73_Zm00001d026031 [Zea mays]|nr:hypothetical protein ZEAMMB73_Zm00001d026031 [Zea mays]